MSYDWPCQTLPSSPCLRKTPLSLFGLMISIESLTTVGHTGQGERRLATTPAPQNPAGFTVVPNGFSTLGQSGELLQNGNSSAGIREADVAWSDLRRFPLFPESACEGFFVKNICRTTPPLHLHIFTSAQSRSHLYLCSSSHLRIYISAHLHILASTQLIFIFTHLRLSLLPSSHLHIYISAHLHLHTSTSLLMFTPAHLHLCSCSHPHIYISHLHLSLFFRRCRRSTTKRSPLRRSCVSRARNAGESAICPGPAQPWPWPSAEIVRVECAKCRRECDLSGSSATLCGDRACRGREMQARARFVPVRRNPLQRSCVSRARNAGESAIWFCPAQPSAEIVRVECAKRRRQGDESHARTYLGSWKMRTGDFVVQL